MIAELKPYTTMKDSGVPWLGDVPKHWEIRKLRQLLRRQTQRNRPDLPLLSVVREKGVILRDITSADENHNFIPDDLSNYKVVRAGQFAINKMKAWQGSFGVSRHDGIVSPAYFVFDLTGLTGNFFHTAIRSRTYVPAFTRASDGVRIGQWDLAESRMREIQFVVPPLSEQAAIVRFLDHYDRKIRRYIRAKQKLIKLLEEEKQAIIHHSVTRGLDPNVRLKSSGVEWLGDIPAHWKVKKLKFEMNFRGGGTPSRVESSYWNGDIPWVSPKDMKSDVISDTVDHITDKAVTESSTNLVPAGAILMVVRSGILQRTIPIAICARQVALNQDMKALSSIGKLTTAYFILLVRGCENTLLTEWTKQGATVESIEHQFLSNTKIPVPPIEEQSAINHAISQETKGISSAISHARQEVSLLREYRTCLIANVVTGKLDVRKAAADLPNEPVELEPLEEVDTLTDEEGSCADLDTIPEVPEA